MTMPVRDRRLLLGDAAVLSLDEACALLPMDKQAARAWLNRHGVVRELGRNNVVVWGDVLTVLRGDTSGAERRTVYRRSKAWRAGTTTKEGR